MTFSFRISRILKGDGSERSGYVVCGLHCCGDLSEAVLKLFHLDPNARGLVLVSCCYHKMSLRDSNCEDQAEDQNFSVYLLHVLCIFAYYLDRFHSDFMPIRCML